MWVAAGCELGNCSPAQTPGHSHIPDTFSAVSCGGFGITMDIKLLGGRWEQANNPMRWVSLLSYFTNEETEAE